MNHKKFNTFTAKLCTDHSSTNNTNKQQNKKNTKSKTMKHKEIEKFNTSTAQLCTNNPSNKQYKQTKTDVKTMQHRDVEIVTRDSILGYMEFFAHCRSIGHEQSIQRE